MSRALKKLGKEVLDRIAEGLAHVGLSRRSDRWFGKQIGELEGAIGINVREFADIERLEVNPIVGVRHEELERLVDILARQTGGKWYPSVTVAVANIAPEIVDERREQDYAVHAGENPDTVVRWIIHCAEDVAPRFWSENSSLRAIAATVASHRFPIAEDRLLPIAYYLLGDRAAAEDVMRRYTGVDPYSSYPVFCQKVREMFETRPT